MKAPRTRNDEPSLHEPLSLDEVRAVLGKAPCKWWIAGGWALELFLRQQTRPHSDVDVSILRRDQHELKSYLRGWIFEYIEAGQGRPWNGEELRSSVHEVWGRQKDSPGWQLEFVVDQSDGPDWVYRRNAEIRLPFERLDALTVDGLPVLPPEIVLLHKSTLLDVKNQQDFAATVLSLDSESREWLRNALLLTDPGHPWIPELSESAEPAAPKRI